MEDASHSESIRKIVDCIENNLVVLPEFQRDFVWEIGKTHDLLDSLVREVFIGALIYGIPSFEISVRDIDTRSRRKKGMRRKSLKVRHFDVAEVKKKVQTTGFRLILDGQQRITSLYRALKGYDEIWFIVKNEEEIDFKIRNKQISERTLEDNLLHFAGQEDPSRLSIFIADVWRMVIGEVKREKEKKFLLEDSQYSKNHFIEHGTDSDELFEKYLDITEKLQDLLKADKLLSYYQLDTTSEKFALFFERSNTRSITLGFVDILSAKLYQGFNLRRHIDDFRDEFEHIELVPEVIVRAISCIVSDTKNIERAYILSKLNFTHFADYWDEICSIYNTALDWIFKNNFALSQSWLPYENMLIPFIIFIRELHGKDLTQMSQVQSNFLKYWYWASIFSLRYSGSSNEVILKDAKVMREVANNGFLTDKYFFSRFKLQIASDSDLFQLVKKQSASYKGMLNLIHFDVGGLIDWTNTNKLSFTRKVEDHHIFPRRYIEKTYKGDESTMELIDCVANRTLIPKLTNIKIGEKSPSVYLQDLKNKNSHLESSLTNHLIPPDILNGKLDNDFESFLLKRSENMWKLIEKHVINMEDEVKKSLQRPK